MRHEYEITKERLVTVSPPPVPITAVYYDEELKEIYKEPIIFIETYEIKTYSPSAIVEEHLVDGYEKDVFT